MQRPAVQDVRAYLHCDMLRHDTAQPVLQRRARAAAGRGLQADVGGKHWQRRLWLHWHRRRVLLLAPLAAAAVLLAPATHAAQQPCCAGQEQRAGGGQAWQREPCCPVPAAAAAAVLLLQALLKAEVCLLPHRKTCAARGCMDLLLLLLLLSGASRRALVARLLLRGCCWLAGRSGCGRCGAHVNQQQRRRSWAPSLVAWPDCLCSTQLYWRQAAAHAPPRRQLWPAGRCFSSGSG